MIDRALSRRTFVKWARNAAGLFMLAPEELLEPRKRFWPGATFETPTFKKAPKAPFHNLHVVRAVIYDAHSGSVLIERALDFTMNNGEMWVQPSADLIFEAVGDSVDVKAALEVDLLEMPRTVPLGDGRPYSLSSGDTLSVLFRHSLQLTLTQ